MTIAKPTQVSTPFANSGLKNSIPQSATGSNLASLEEGFPAVTMAAVADGGTPPQGQDFNGILNQVTNQLRYAQAGGLYPYDSTFCTAIGGYPLGAILMSADGSKLWQNQTAGNTNNPDSDDTNWLELCTVSALTAGLAAKQGTLTFDSTPTANSSNPVTSDGIKTALDGKLSLTGGEMSGLLKLAGDIYPSLELYADANVQAEIKIGSSTTGETVSLLVDSQGYAKGLFDTNTLSWIICRNQNGNIVSEGKLVETVDSSSSNSGYIRYKSGIQLCWGTITGTGTSTATTLTYPVPFISAPGIAFTGNGKANSLNFAGVKTSPRGATSCGVQVIRNTSGSNVNTYAADTVDWLAIGMWK